MVVARAAVPGFYGKPPSLSLVDQCGGAGRTALAEVQRYPDEFDVIAASGLDTESTRHAMGQLWVWQTAHKTPESPIPAAKLPALIAPRSTRVTATTASRTASSRIRSTAGSIRP